MAKVKCVVRVADLYKECSYPRINNARAMSDCCRAPAVFEVHQVSEIEVAEGNVSFWRCGDHETLLPDGSEGISSDVSVASYDKDYIPKNVIMVIEK